MPTRTLDDPDPSDRSDPSDPLDAYDQRMRDQQAKQAKQATDQGNATDDQTLYRGKDAGLPSGQNGPKLIRDATENPVGDVDQHAQAGYGTPGAKGGQKGAGEQFHTEGWENDQHADRTTWGQSGERGPPGRAEHPDD